MLHYCRNIIFRWIMLALCFGGLMITEAHALRNARPTSIDRRIRVINYNPNDVFSFTGFYGYQSTIEFAEGESINTITMGDSTAWLTESIDNRLFLKPIEPNATTNMTVLTNARMYHFELHAKQTKSINDPDLTFTLRFLYADDAPLIQGAANTGPAGPDLRDPEKYNFNYTVSGSEYISPLKVFDDGEFTYMQFRDKNAEIPAIFFVDPNGQESIVNYRVAGKYIVIERVASRFTLRSGYDITCLFNHAMPMRLVHADQMR